MKTQRKSFEIYKLTKKKNFMSIFTKIYTQNKKQKKKHCKCLIVKFECFIKLNLKNSKNKEQKKTIK